MTVRTGQIDHPAAQHAIRPDRPLSGIIRVEQGHDRRGITAQGIGDGVGDGRRTAGQMRPEPQAGHVGAPVRHKDQRDVSTPDAQLCTLFGAGRKQSLADMETSARIRDKEQHLRTGGEFQDGFHFAFQRQDGR